MAEVINMSINASYPDYSAGVLDLRKRARESPERHIPSKRCAIGMQPSRIYPEDNHRSKVVSPVNSHGSFTPSPTSSIDYDAWDNSPYSHHKIATPVATPTAQKFKVHAPIQWPMEAIRGYTFDEAPFAGKNQFRVEANDLHARYSEFFDYAKNKFSAPAMSYSSAYHIQKSCVQPFTETKRSSESPPPTFHMNSARRLSRSASLSPNVPQPHSPLHSERISSPTSQETARPKSAENPAFRLPLAPSPISINSTKLEGGTCTDSSNLSISPSSISIPRTGSSLSRADSLSGKTSPSTLDTSEPSPESTKNLSSIANADSTAKLSSLPTSIHGMFLDQVHPVLSLTDKIITAGITGKPTRPFKAYPKDPLFLATSLAALDPEEYRYSQQAYHDFRDKMLAQTRSISGQSNPKMKRSGSPNSGEHDPNESSKDAQYWERRRKNNEAAKRSRDARKAKEDEIAIRAAYLENQNRILTAEIKHLRFVTDQLRHLAQERTYAV